MKTTRSPFHGVGMAEAEQTSFVPTGDRHLAAPWGGRYLSAWSSAMVPVVTVEGIHCPLLLTASDTGAAVLFPLPAIFRGGGRE